MRRAHEIRNRVFVTGVIRSGTTFVGDVLALGRHVDYIHEPFLGGYTLPDKTRLEPRYVRPGTDSDPDVVHYDAQLQAILDYRISIPSARYDGDARLRKFVKQLVGSRGPFYLRLAKLNPFAKATVIKDPYGKLAAERLYLRFGVKPVVVVKHPVSLAASLSRVGWWPELKDFREDVRLREDYFNGEDEFFDKTWESRLLESMGHWRASYKILLDQAERHDWCVVVHEELSANPVVEFKRIFERVGLPFSDAVERKVIALTSEGSTSARKGRVQDFKRDSARIFEHRRDSIPAEQRAQIFDVVADIALRLYSRESFALD
jgi:hypothetical protein